MAGAFHRRCASDTRPGGATAQVDESAPTLAGRIIPTSPRWFARAIPCILDVITVCPHPPRSQAATSAANKLGSEPHARVLQNQSGSFDFEARSRQSAGTVRPV